MIPNVGQPAADANAVYDAIVVGGGIGGIYAVYRFRESGFRVLGIEGAAGFGGVWFHNGYPGARVDFDSIDYSYYFSEELYREWKWSERFATQPELMRYLNHVADRFDVRRDFVFNAWVVGAQWQPESDRYEVVTEDGQRFAARFVVMATGNLSRPRELRFEGIERFHGEWVRTSRWPQREVAMAGRRVGVVGTGSSGVQTISAIADQVGELYVFQRTPHYVIPAGNGPLDEGKWEQIRANVRKEREWLFGTVAAHHGKRGTKPTSDCTPEECQAIMLAQWELGGLQFAGMFPDQRTDLAANEIVAEFVRAKIRSIVDDPAVAESLCPNTYPIGTRRLILSSGYYESFNLPHVSLVDLRRTPIETITERGIRTVEREYELDLIIFATGFDAFVGSIDDANIRNERGETPTGGWTEGPRTFLGLMTPNFPNLFVLTGPGSPSVLSNMVLQNEFHAEWVARLLCFMRDAGLTRVEPEARAADEWSAHVAAVGHGTLRQRSRNYQVHIRSDGTQVMIPYAGGFAAYAQRALAVEQNEYEGLAFA